jgi:fructose-1,6-bisphosphatase/inositol monophosphatase family enzyme
VPLFIYRFYSRAKNALFFLGETSADKNDSWKFRRALIFGAYRLSVAMIIFGAITFFFDSGVSNQLVIGGVAILCIIVSAYVAGATIEDTHNKKNLEP